MNVENRLDCTNGASASLPGAEEFRMVRAIALLALLEAARDGEYRATFHGFRIHARRQCPPDADAYVEVNLCVTLGKAIVERGVVATRDAGSGNQSAESRSSALNSSRPSPPAIEQTGWMPQVFYAG